MIFREPGIPGFLGKKPQLTPTRGDVVLAGAEHSGRFQIAVNRYLTFEPTCFSKFNHHSSKIILQSTQILTKHWSVEPEKIDKKSKNKNNSNVTTEEKLNHLKDSIKGTLTRLEAFTSEKTVSKDTSVTEIEIKLKKIEQLQINLDKIAEDYCEIETFESLEIIQLDIEDINQRIETTETSFWCLHAQSRDYKFFASQMHIKNHTVGERGIETNLNPTRFEGQPEVAVLTYGNKCVLLNTFMIFVKSADGYRIKLRGLLDNAPTICVMREDIARKLKFRSANQSITGINGITQASKYSANIEVSNRDYTFARNLQFSLLPKITDAIPVSKLNISDLNIPASIELADSNFHMPGQIDILIGSELFFEILIPEQYYLQEGNVILQNTKFGYLVTGTLPQSQQQANCFLISEPSLDITVKKFFELESLPDDSKEITKSEEEIYCEEHFVSTYKRNKTGRFIVRLPIKENAETLFGYSKENAIKRLNGIREKLNKNNAMGILYKEFMNEYELFGHMEEIKNETLDKINYYIPHHSVYKPEKTSTPLRVVFDASAKTTSGFSLNSILLNGGIIQQDLFSIVSRFRKHEYAFSADIKKMYRQILVDPNQRDLQRIMWKTSADAPVKTYKLASVTYGTVSAPFLATRTLKALADEEKAEFPDAADVICKDSYMDDILSRGC
ncbi:DUF1758 domain-containing protein [Trichonephila clavipes]|nr:DUF1758 domain-containing protein [Trichonephila clavipes]